jgi:hypothetical protein
MNNLAPRSLAAPRSSAGVAVATDRANPTFHHIFAIGGFNGTSMLGSYEHLTISENSPVAETIGGDWVTGANPPTARSELGAVVADPTTASTTGTNVCVFALAGRTGATQATGLVEAALLPLMGADLGLWTSTFAGAGPPDVPSMPAGLSAVLANSTIYVFGGTQGGGSTPGALVSMRTLSGAGAACSTFAGPWNSVSTTNLRARALSGTAVIGGFVYVIGGNVAQAGATCGDGTADMAAASCIVDAAVVGGQP